MHWKINSYNNYSQAKVTYTQNNVYTNLHYIELHLRFTFIYVQIYLLIIPRKQNVV